MRKKDVIISPYYVSPEYRGHGIGGDLLKVALSNGNKKWKIIYGIVKKDNTASIKVLKKIGFELVGYAKKRVWSYALSETPTDLLVFVAIKAYKEADSVFEITAVFTK